MAAGPIGSVWKSESWPDTAWTAGSWNTAVIPPIPPAATGPQVGGGRRIKWSEVFPDAKEATKTRRLTNAEGDALFAHTAPTREDGMVLAILLHTLNEDS